MDDDPTPGQDPPQLRFLRRLVTVLTATMILGVLTIVALLVIRLQTPSSLALPDSIALPDGTQVTAFTQGTGWFAVVTADNKLLIFHRQNGTLLQTVEIAR